MTGRAYTGGSTEPSLAEIHQEMSELLDKEKIFRGSRKLPQAHEKVRDENEETRKKRCACKYVFNGRKWFMRGTGETDRYEALVNDS